MNIKLVKPHEREFGQLVEGECFIVGGVPYMKCYITETELDTINAVGLQDGSFDLFGNTDMVRPIDVDIEVKL